MFDPNPAGIDLYKTIYEHDAYEEATQRCTGFSVRVRPHVQ